MKKRNECRKRGSVSRAIRRRKRFEEDIEYREKTIKSRLKSRLKRKREINKRCLNCGKLILSPSELCRKCYLSRNKKSGEKE